MDLPLLPALHDPKERATLLAMATRRFVLALLALLAVSCVSPTLPLPPPSKPNVEGPDAAGNVTLDGYAENGDRVIAWNHQTGDIRGQEVKDPNGHYRFPIPAQIGDAIELWYTSGDEQSTSLVFTIQAPPP